MNAKQAMRLTDAELSERATAVRQQIEAIRPYFVRSLSDEQRIYRDEFTRRQADKDWLARKLAQNPEA